MDEEKKLTGIEVAKVLTGLAHNALVAYEPDNKVSMDEVMELVKEGIAEFLAEAND
jgi:hypothetical protein